jgi:hypothetical protein
MACVKGMACPRDDAVDAEGEGAFEERDAIARVLLKGLGLLRRVTWALIAEPERTPTKARAHAVITTGLRR